MKSCIRRLAAIVAVLAMSLLTGCADAPFDIEAAHSTIESQPLALSGEHVVLNGEQIACGARKGLWTVSEDIGLARLSAEGQALFGDDVRLRGKDTPGGTTPLRGTFPIKVFSIESLKDNAIGVKIAEARVGVVLAHSCFPDPIPLLGIYRGNFSDEAAPRLRLEEAQGWAAVAVLH
jgi:hypothetical protein